MAEFKTVMKERKRMCKQIGNCDKCQLSFHNNKSESFCDTFMRESPAKAEQIIMQWVAENPLKTNGAKFREVFGYDFAKVVCAADWCNAEYKGEKQNG